MGISLLAVEKKTEAVIDAPMYGGDVCSSNIVSRELEYTVYSGEVSFVNTLVGK